VHYAVHNYTRRRHDRCITNDSHVTLQVDSIIEVDVKTNQEAPSICEVPVSIETERAVAA